MKNLLLCVLILVTPLSSVFAGSTSDQGLLNSPAPLYSLVDVNNRLYSSAEWKGKMIVLNFWATWCAPCMKEIPLLNKMQKEYEEDGLVVVGIAIDNREAVKKFNQIIPIDYINLIGGTDATSLTMQYGNRAGVLPYTVIISKTGRIASIAQGLLTEAYLRQSIEKWL